MITQYQNAILFTALLCSVMLLMSCGSSDVLQTLSAEERFAIGKQKFDDEEYLEAINEFQVIKLQYPASAVADDAQLYLAECYYAREEFLLAVEEYQSLKRLMASSPLVSQAQHKIAMCYYSLSPRSTLDQTYSLKAIEEFQSFIEDYKTDSLVANAEVKIHELNTRLAQKWFDTAELYIKLEYYRSATYYYDLIVEKYHDTEFAEPAHINKVKVLVTRKKFDDAKAELGKFLERYPNSQFKGDAESLRSVIDEALKSRSSAAKSSRVNNVSSNLRP